jgi:WD40 repeat protein
VDKISRWDWTTRQELPPMHIGGGHQTPLAFTPDGKTLVTIRVGSPEQSVRLWKFPSGEPALPLLGHTGAVLCIAFSADGKTLASRGADATFRLWDVAARKEIRQMEMEVADQGTRDENPGQGLALSPDGRTMAGNLPLGKPDLLLWDTASGKVRCRLTRYRPWSLAFSPDGQTLALNFGGDRLGLVSAATGEEKHVLRGATDAPGGTPGQCVIFSPDGRLLVSGGGDKIRFWSVGQDRLLRSVPTGRRVGVGGLAFSPSGLVLASCQEPGLVSLSNPSDTEGESPIFLWDGVVGAPLSRLAGKGVITSIAFSPDGRTLVSGGKGDRAVRLWDTWTGKQLVCLEGHTGGVTTVAFSPDGRTVASGSNDTTMLLWDVSSFLPRRETTDPSREEIDAQWTNLGFPEGGKAFQAFIALSRAGDKAVAFLKERLPPARAADTKQVRALVAKLDDDSPRAREEASRQLEDMGDSAEPALREALEGKLSLEAKRRVQELLERPDDSTADPRAVRRQRAVVVLEQIGSPAARAYLEELARGLPQARLTREAKAALARLDRRPPRP